MTLLLFVGFRIEYVRASNPCEGLARNKSIKYEGPNKFLDNIKSNKELNALCSYLMNSD